MGGAREGGRGGKRGRWGGSEGRGGVERQADTQLRRAACYVHIYDLISSYIIIHNHT
jgi:hypothetical protein